MVQAGVYGAVTHYLKAIEAAKSDEGKAVVAKMREIPINDFMTKNGKLREDGRVMRDMYLFQVRRRAIPSISTTTTSSSRRSRRRRPFGRSARALARWSRKAHPIA